MNGKFGETVAFTFDEVTAMRSSEGSLTYRENGMIVHEYVKSYISFNLTQSVYRAAACNDEAGKAALLLRYPGNAGLFADATLTAGMCNASVQTLADLKARIATNQRRK